MKSISIHQGAWVRRFPVYEHIKAWAIKLFYIADKAGKIAFGIASACLAVACFVKFVEAAILVAYYSDLCAVMSVMLVAP